MQLFLLLLTVWLWSVQPAAGADIIPAPPVPSVPPSDTPQQELSRNLSRNHCPVPETQAWSSSPTRCLHPDSVIVPPVVDPKMAVNPDEPPKQEPMPPREPDPRKSPDQSR